MWMLEVQLLFLRVHWDNREKNFSWERLWWGEEIWSCDLLYRRIWDKRFASFLRRLQNNSELLHSLVIYWYSCIEFIQWMNYSIVLFRSTLRLLKHRPSRNWVGHTVTQSRLGDGECLPVLILHFCRVAYTQMKNALWTRHLHSSVRPSIFCLWTSLHVPALQPQNRFQLNWRLVSGIHSFNHSLKFTSFHPLVPLVSSAHMLDFYLCLSSLDFAYHPSYCLSSYLLISDKYVRHCHKNRRRSAAFFWSFFAKCKMNINTLLRFIISCRGRRIQGLWFAVHVPLTLLLVRQLKWRSCALIIHKVQCIHRFLLYS